MSLPHEQTSQTGVKPFQQVGYQNGASSPRQNAIAYRQSQVTEQQKINGNTTGGSKNKKRKYNGGSNNIVVPSFPNSGPPISAPGQDANSNSVGANTTSTQSAANASCDSCIGDASKTAHCQSAACNPQSGGGSCNGMGLIGLNQTWGCMSGGKLKIIKRKKTRHTKKKQRKTKTKTKRKNKKSKKLKKRKSKK